MLEGREGRSKGVRVEVGGRRSEVEEEEREDCSSSEKTEVGSC
jgi:hypothetical protein